MNEPRLSLSVRTKALLLLLGSSTAIGLVLLPMLLGLALLSLLLAWRLFVAMLAGRFLGLEGAWALLGALPVGLFSLIGLQSLKLAESYVRITWAAGKKIWRK